VVTVHLIVGLPGAGKTTRARELEVSETALRLTPDEWQTAIFDGDGPTRWRTRERADHRDRIEGKLVEVGMRAAAAGLDVVLDFGLWGRDERSALRWIAGTLGVRAHVVYLPITYEEQRRRIRHRYETQAGQFEMTDVELETWHEQFEAPDAEELRGGAVPVVPHGYRTWSQWASVRWPSLPDRYETSSTARSAVRHDPHGPQPPPRAR
jgi:predicted kinase